MIQTKQPGATPAPGLAFHVNQENAAMNVLLTRIAHDRLLESPLLNHLFATYAHSWSLAGVTFRDVRQEDRDALAEALT